MLNTLIILMGLFNEFLSHCIELPIKASCNIIVLLLCPANYHDYL